MFLALIIIKILKVNNYIFWPHLGQNRDVGGISAPHLGHRLPDGRTVCGAPQCGQKAAPGVSWAPQELQVAPPVVACCNGVPQLTQRLAFFGLSAPHFGHGLYSLPQ